MFFKWKGKMKFIDPVRKMEFILPVLFLYAIMKRMSEKTLQDNSDSAISGDRRRLCGAKKLLA